MLDVWTWLQYSAKKRLSSQRLAIKVFLLSCWFWQPFSSLDRAEKCSMSGTVIALSNSRSSKSAGVSPVSVSCFLSMAVKDR